jgi:hypothetical protein
MQTFFTILPCQAENKAKINAVLLGFLVQPQSGTAFRTPRRSAHTERWRKSAGRGVRARQRRFPLRRLSMVRVLK